MFNLSKCDGSGEWGMLFFKSSVGIVRVLGSNFLLLCYHLSLLLKLMLFFIILLLNLLDFKFIIIAIRYHFSMDGFFYF